MESLFATLKSLLRNDRSIRRFDNSRSVSREDLVELIDLTRYCGSGRNLQPLKYRLVHDREECEKIYPLLKWAGYLSDWDGPVAEERPVAYIVQCLDTRLTKSLLCDDGLQLQAITLGATAKGLGGCIIKSFNIPVLTKTLDIPEYMNPIYIYALGYPAEQVELEPTDGSLDADIKYYRTADGIHHVPKRPLTELLL